MKTVRRSSRQRRVMREPDSVYFDDLQMSILHLGFELSAAEKELLMTPAEEGLAFCDNSMVRSKRGRNTEKIKRPSKADVDILVSALKSIEEEPIYKQRVTEEGVNIRYSNEAKAIKQVDLNTEDSSSDGGSPKSIFGIHEGSEPIAEPITIN